MRYYIDHEHRAYLQSFRGLVRPEFIAEGGLVVQIPVKNSEVSQQQLRAEILKLSQEQGNEYLRALAEWLGGAGDRVNLVPMQSVLNRGDYKAMEKHFLDELKAGKSISVKIELGYANSNSTRPSSFKIVAITNGKPKEWRFDQ